ncbi:MAG: Dyp-type peroxidase [Burkholderiaceae bacterium]|nr:Dyp-type peroxidase [Burkholderiaceae bacterium]
MSATRTRQRAAARGDAIVHQTGILAPVPAHARYLSFVLRPDADAGAALDELAAPMFADGDSIVVGLGESMLQALGAAVPGLRTMTPIEGAKVAVPSTPAALWVWLRGKDRGELLHRSRVIEEALAESLELDSAIDGFMFDGGRDLSGYLDGIENPKGRKAAKAALVAGAGDGLDGGSFVAVQQWLHDLDHFESLSPETRDHIFGRSRLTDEELDDAPPAAHVKRTAQEDFDPEAFVVRRSMPWADAMDAGLVFVSFGDTLDKFEAQLRRMVGAEDGIVDNLFRFTRPVTGAYFWCPPVRDGRLDFTAIEG